MTPFRFVALLVIALGASVACAADQAKINTAISAGTEYLKKNHAPGAAPVPAQAAPAMMMDHPIGRASLVGIALIEGGVKRDDPAVQNIVQLVRSRALAENQTYDIALAILLLDVLHDPSNEGLIQFLGVRLYAGMNATGGWSYQCGAVPNGTELAQLQALLQQNQLVGQPAQKEKPAKPANGFPQATKKEAQNPNKPSTGKLHPIVAAYYQRVRQAPSGAQDGMMGQGDNSNTQFGLIGLWVAARHGVPANDAFAKIEARFLVSQNKADAGWSYSGGGASTAAMTCAGLLGLAVGTGRSRPAPKAKKPIGSPDDPFFNPKKSAEGEKGSAAPTARPAVKLAIEAALKSLGRAIQAARVGDLKNFTGLGNQYYLLWSIERAAVAYGLDTIGETDWYAWASDLLIAKQQQDGSWPGESYGSDVNTSFAILVLCKSNFVADLSAKIKGQVKDPGKAELRGGGGAAPPLFAPQQVGDSSSAKAAKPPAEEPMPTPALPQVTPGASADPIAAGLVAAGDDFTTKLTAARDTKGGEQTAGLVHAIARLSGARKKQAREALAERLTRMTAKTLRQMLADPDAELRRAACLACAMKDDKSHIPDLIERITDSSDVVVPAARAGLKSLTGKDFGPPSGADEAAKAKAHAAWTEWYETEGR